MGNEVLPPGFKFSPSDEVLLVYYLMPQIYRKKLPCNMVTEKEIYGPQANPWHLFNASSTSWTDSSKSEKTVYVFTRLTTKAASSCPATDKKTEHYVRIAGCGTWHDETGRKQIIVRNGENVIKGSKKLLVYKINDIGGLGDGINLDEVGYWKMHEYCLDGFEDYVLCAITWDTSKKAKVVVAKSLSRSRSSTKRKAQISHTHVLAGSAKVGTIDSPFTSDDSAEVGMNEPRLSSEKNSGVPDLGLVQDNYVVQEGSLNWMNTDCTLPASTSCADIVSGNDFFLDVGDLFTDMSEEELESYKNLSLEDIDEMLNTLQDFSAALPFSPPDNNNDEQHPMKDYCSQALGKRKSTEVERSGKKLCI
ncbi:hypothetical protein POM88_027017 [Heracleum sosnowskyi]|uniref:NAC domain-containing protein n=1 Tax=Heracleum sosnowskyi TaxID=360622 RepID=A0AAD8I7P0_9APIA|nr:hypothetical protein POM88_027017 [Heracleum sosnowskyi]